MLNRPTLRDFKLTSLFVPSKKNSRYGQKRLTCVEDTGRNFQRLRKKGFQLAESELAGLRLRLKQINVDALGEKKKLRLPQIFFMFPIGTTVKKH